MLRSWVAMNEPRWLVVRDRCSRPLNFTLLPPGTDLKAAMTAEHERRIADGWKADELGCYTSCSVSVATTAGASRSNASSPGPRVSGTASILGSKTRNPDSRIAEDCCSSERIKQEELGEKEHAASEDATPDAELHPNGFLLPARPPCPMVSVDTPNPRTAQAPARLLQIALFKRLAGLRDVPFDILTPFKGEPTRAFDEHCRCHGFAFLAFSDSGKCFECHPQRSGQ